MTTARTSHPGLFETLENRRLLAGNIIYVDVDVREHSASDVRDGSSWANAYDDLQAALQRAARDSGVDVTDHEAWDRWLGNPVVPCDVRMARRRDLA